MAFVVLQGHDRLLDSHLWEEEEGGGGGTGLDSSFGVVDLGARGSVEGL